MRIRVGKKTSTSILSALVFFSIVAVPSHAQTVQVTSSSPPEAKLAAIDEGSTIVRISLIRQYGQRLDSLDRKCKERRGFIGDLAVKGVELLQQRKAVRMSILRFLSAMDDSIPEGSDSLNLSCAEIAAALVVMIDRP